MPRSPYRTVPDRFWANVQEGDGCWSWKAAHNHMGYGQFVVQVGSGRWRNRMAHRMAWILANAEDIPEDRVVAHMCDNPGCVNPAHLTLMTQAENLADMTAKGRRRNQNNGRTHCKRKGHPLTGDNVYRYTRKNGREYRMCRTCLLEQSAERYARRIAAKDRGLAA